MAKKYRDYISFLPECLQESAENGQPFLEDYLKIFERILTHEDCETLPQKNISQMLDAMANLFRPTQLAKQKEMLDKISQPIQWAEQKELPCQPDNLNDFALWLKQYTQWMATWIALVLPDFWDIGKKCEVLARMIPLYRMRGTKAGLEKYLHIYLEEVFAKYPDTKVWVDEKYPPAFIVEEEKSSFVGGEAAIEGRPPYFFRVCLQLPLYNNEVIQTIIRAVRIIVDTEKPAHTRYELDVRLPTIQIQHENLQEVEKSKSSCYVEINTLLGQKEINAYLTKVKK